MSSGIESLHKILKDETRRKIIAILNEKGAAGYTELLNQTEIDSTGKLNYHLKVLGDLVEKNDGRYMLSEKGKLASRLITEFPAQDDPLQEKKKWWKRFWIAAITLQAVTLTFFGALYLSGNISVIWLMQAIIGFIGGTLFLYFFYRMIRPINPKQPQSQTLNQERTIGDITVLGRQIEEVKSEVMRWIKQEKIVVEDEREDFVRGRLGIPSGLGWTAPKYFEVTLKPNVNGVTVHTEGWISLYDVSERSFSSSALIMGGIPRKKGWQVMENLWARLSAFSKNA